MIKVIPTSNGVKYIDEKGNEVDNSAIDSMPKQQGIVDTVTNTVSNFFIQATDENKTYSPGTQWNYDTAKSLAATYGAFVDSNADKNAKIEEAAKIVDVPSYVVRQQPELENLALKKAVEIKQSPDDWEEFVTKYPSTATWLSNPNNMAVAHDDIKPLAFIEDIGNNFSVAREMRIAENDLSNLLWRNHLNGINDIDNFNDDDKAAVVRFNNKIASLRKSIPEYSPTSVSYYFNPNSLAQILGSVTPGFQNATKRSLEGALLGAGSGAIIGSVAGGVGAVPGSVVGAELGASTGFKVGLGEEAAIHDWGQAYYKNIMKRDINGNKMNTTAASASAYGQAAVGFGLGAYGGEVTTTAGKKIAAAIGKEAVEDAAVETAKTSAIKTLSFNIAKNAAEQMLIGGGMAATNYGIDRGAEKLSGQTFNHSNDADFSTQVIHGALSMLPFSYISAPGHAADFVRQLNNAAAESKLLKRSQSQFEDHLDSITNNSPIENMYIPAKELVEYFQDALPDDKAKEMMDKLGVTEQLSEAVVTGADIEIPTSKFFSVLGGTKYADDLATHVKFDEHDITENHVNEQIKSNYENEIQKAASNIDEQIGKEPIKPEQTSSFDEWKQKFIDVGLNKTQAESYAQLLAAYSDTAEARGYFNSKDFLSKVNIEKSESPEPGIKKTYNQIKAFVQGEKEITKTPEFKKWFGDSKVVDESGNPLIVYHTGTMGDTYDMTKSRSYNGSPDYEIPGIYLTANKTESKEYGTADQTKTLYVSIKNPFKGNTTALHKELGTWRKVMDRLIEKGYDGIINDDGYGEIIAFSPKQIKSVKNDGAFDSSNPNIYHSEKDGIYRGSFTGNEDIGGIIKLFGGKDNSTVIHEAGHLFLDTMDKLSKGEEQPQQLTTDYQTIRKWLGAKENESLTKEQHEKFAKGFETYLREGKAPSSELMKAFNKFKTWLTNIYKRVADLGVEVSPEVKAVMDRMLATDEQISHVESFKNFADEINKKDLKVSDFKRYIKLKEEAHAEAVNTLLKSRLEELNPDLLDRANKAAEEARPSIEKEVSESPVYEAARELEKFAGNLQSAKTIAAEYLQNKMSHHQKIGLDIVAEANGFRDTKSLMKQIFKMKKTENEIVDRINSVKEDYIKNELGLSNPIDDSVKAIHNESQLHVLSLETEILREKVREKFASPEEKLKIQKDKEAYTKKENEMNQRWKEAENDFITKIDNAKSKEEIDSLKAEMADMKKQHEQEMRHAKKEAEYNQRWNDAEKWSEDQQNRMARQGQLNYKLAIDTAKTIIENKPLYTRGKADATNWRKYLTLERKARAEANRLINKGEYEKAVDFKNQEMLNHALAIEAIKAEKQVKKYLIYFDKLSKVKPESININDKYQIDKILSRFDLTKKNPADGILSEHQISLLTWIQGDGADIVGKEKLGWKLDIPNSILSEGNAKNYRQMNLKELADVNDALKQIEFVSRNANKLFKNQMHQDLNECTTSLYTKAMENVGEQHPFTTNPNRNMLKKIADIPRFINAELLKVETLTDRLDGFTAKKGEWFHSFIKPISEAYNDKYRRLEKATLEFRNILNKHYTKDELSEFRKVNTRIDSLGYELSREQMIAILLNWGNKGNKERLLNGKNWTIENVNEVFKKLDKKDFDFAQDIWNFLDTFAPELAKLEQETSGGKFKKVEADSFEWDGNTYKGGYYPAVADPEMSINARINNESLIAGKYNIPNVRATTKAGRTKERAASTSYQIRLDLDVINEHINEVIHDITHRKAIIDTNRILYSSNIKEVVSRTMGQEYWFALQDYVDRVAKEGKISKSEIEQISSKLRANISIAAMSYKVSVMIPQMLGYIQVAEYMGVPKTLHAFTSFISNPIDMKNKINFVYDKSAFMAERSSNFDRDGRDMMKKQFADKPKLKQMNEKGFWLMGVFDQVATIPCWLEAYKDGMKKYNGDEGMAIEHADSIIRQSVGSGAPKDLAKFMAGSEWQKWLTMFSSFTSAFYNLTYRRFQITKGAGDFTTSQRINGAISYLTLQLFLAPMLNEIFAGRSPDKNESKIKWMFKTILGNTASMLPVAGPVLNAGLSKVFGEFATYRATPFNNIADSIIKVFTNAAKQIKEGNNKYGIAKSLAESSAYFIPYPMQFVTTGENVYDKFILNKKLDWNELPYKQHKENH